LHPLLINANRQGFGETFRRAANTNRQIQQAYGLFQAQATKDRSDKQHCSIHHEAASCTDGQFVKAGVANHVFIAPALDDAQTQTMTLILIEDIDVIFEEDKVCTCRIIITWVQFTAEFLERH
jgi:hypothetical protein